MDGLLPNLNLHQLRYLREAANAETWTAAASNLGVSQSALSQGIAELERRLGIALFERDGRVRRLTPQAVDVLSYAEKVLAQTSDLTRHIERFESGAAGTLRVGMIDAAFLYLLPDVISRFRAERPHVDLRLSVRPSTELLKACRRGDLDIAFVVAPDGTLPDFAGHLTSSLVTVESMWLCVARNATPLPSTVADAVAIAIAGEQPRWVMYPATSQTRSIVDGGMAKHGLTTAGLGGEVAAESGNPRVLRQMVELGLGWSVLPESIALSAANIKPVGPASIAARPIVAARRTDAPADARAADFLALAESVA
jgi:DNA-binding transcriptional LysR family regulator